MMLSLTVLLLVAVSGVLSASEVSKCTSENVKKVQDQWAKTGQPQSVTSFKESFTVIAGSTSKLSQQGECKVFKFEPPYLVDQSDNKKLSCKESNGVLTLPDSLSYIITFDEKYGILTTVRCSEGGPNPSAANPPIVSVAATDKAPKEEVQKSITLLKNLGFAVDAYNCHKTE